MRAIIVLFTATAIAMIAWRHIFTRKRERKLIRFGVREVFLTLAVAGAMTAGLFLALFNFTMRLI